MNARERMNHIVNGLADVAFSYGFDSEEFKIANLNYMAAFQSLDPEKDWSVIEAESPIDTIFSAIEEEADPDYIEMMINSFKQQVEWLEAISYYRAEEWRANLEECEAEFAEYNK